MKNSPVQISYAESEIEASITKGYLESAGIKASIGPTNNNLPRGGRGALNVPYGVYVEENMAEEAKKILAERN